MQHSVVVLVVFLKCYQDDDEGRKKIENVFEHIVKKGKVNILLQ